MREIQLSQRTPEWKQWRKEGVTATDTPVILGFVPEKSVADLWAEKTGRKEPEDLSKIPAVRFGVENEDYARSLWEIEHVKFATPVCGQWDEDPIFRASFDGITSSYEVLEIKCPFPSGNTLLDVKVRKENSTAYKRYYAQVQHQLLVSGFSKAYLVFLDGDKLIEFEIFRDENLIKEIIRKGKEFFEAVKKDKCPVDNTLWQPKNSDQEILWREAASEFLEAQENIQKWKKIQNGAKEKLKILMNHHEKADYAGLKVSRSYTKGTATLAKIAEKLQENGVVITEDVLECCQGELSERWTFRASSATTSSDLSAFSFEETDEDITTNESLWF